MSIYSAKFQETLVSEQATLRECLKVISSSGLLVACIVDKANCFKSMLTDSDIRRALLAGANLDDCAEPWSNNKPLTCLASATMSELASIVYETGKTVIPLINDDGKLVDIFLFGQVHDYRASQSGVSQTQVSPTRQESSVFILAGGLGSRLRPVVSDRPKPLALVGNKPVLETVIEQFTRVGFYKFYVSLNYKAEQIEEHLAGSQYQNLEIQTVRETKRLGTAGSIGYIKEKISDPLVVCNADVLSTVPYQKVLKTHLEEGADVTCVVRPYTLSVPYGVAKVVNNQIVGLTEKPKSQYLVNAGIYVLSPEVCSWIVPDTYLDMPELITQVIEKNKRVIPFLAHEYWIDVGHPEDYHRANSEYEAYFLNNENQ